MTHCGRIRRLCCVSYKPFFSITPVLLNRVESIAALRERIQSATVQVAWIPALQKDTRARNTHSSTAVEGNPLTLAEVRALEEGVTVAAPVRARRCGSSTGEGSTSITYSRWTNSTGRTARATTVLWTQCAGRATT